MKDISEISLYVSDQLEKIQEVSLFQPLESLKKSTLKKLERRTSVRKNLSVKKLLIKLLKWMVPSFRKDQKAIFKTAVASLLSQSLWKGSKRRELCLQVARQIGKMYEVEDEESLTCLKEHIELLDNPKQIDFQFLILGEEVVKQVQCLLLDEMERSPINSKLQVVHLTGLEEFNFKTSYRKYKVHEITKEGLVTYQAHENKGTSSIRTKESIFPDLRGVVGQRLVHSEEELIGSYSGELSTVQNVLEQILCLLNLNGSSVKLTKDVAGEEEVTILFTSLYAWNEFELICRQKEAISRLNHQTLVSDGRAIRLRLLYMNIPFNAWARLPNPGETSAVIQDLNDKALIYLSYMAFSKLGLPKAQLEQWVWKLDEEGVDFFKKAEKQNKIIDAFRLSMKEILARLEMKHERLAHILTSLLSKKRSDGRVLRGMDYLLYLSELTHLLGIAHHKNCQQSIFRSAAAKAADKARHVFARLSQTPFLPGSSSPTDNHLFSSLYSLYLLWEEPEMHHNMSTGEEHLFQLVMRKNPETARYLSR